MPGNESFFTRYCEFREFCEFVEIMFEVIRGFWTSRHAAGVKLPPLKEPLSRSLHGFAAD